MLKQSKIVYTKFRIKKKYQKKVPRASYENNSLAFLKVFTYSQFHNTL